MKPKKVIINSLWFGIIPQVSTVMHILILPFITPYLTPFDYGVNGLINSYSGFILTLSILGLNVHLTNSFYTHKNYFNLVWGRILAIILISSFAFSLLYAILLFFSLKDIHGSIKAITIICACIPVLMQSNKYLANHYYPLVYKPKQLVIKNLLASIIGLLVTFVCIYFLRLGFLGWIIGAAVSSLIVFFLFFKPLWLDLNVKPIFFIKTERLRKWLKVSLPIIPHTLGFVLLSSSDRIVMQLLDVSISEIGIYSNGYQIGSYIVIVTSAMITAISPRIQELYRGGNNQQLKLLFTFIQITTIISIFLFSIWMPEIYKLLIRNSELQEASSIASIICFSNIAFPFYVFISTPALIEERTSKLLWLVLLPGLINVILNFIFIPLFGYKFAAVTTLISFWILLAIPIFVTYYKRVVLKIFGSRFYLLLLLGFFVLFFVLSHFVVDLSLIFKILISLLFIIIYLFIYKSQKDF